MNPLDPFVLVCHDAGLAGLLAVGACVVVMALVLLFPPRDPAAGYRRGRAARGRKPAA